MPFMPRSRPVRIIIGLALALAALAIGFFVYLVWGGGVALSDRKMIWRMMRDGGIEAPAPEVASAQLRAPPGLDALHVRDRPAERAHDGRDGDR